MKQNEINILWKLSFKKLGLESGDNFVLKHCNNENQNKYKNVIFIFNGENIFPWSPVFKMEKDDIEKLLISIIIGRYEIIKI